MIILPAIDLLSGSCVRLVKGEYDTAHKVAEDPLRTALGFKAAGAEYLHMVDLDGAKDGAKSRLNRKAVAEIIKSINIPVELGGGIRTMEDIEEAVNIGVSRVIIGSAARDKNLLKKAVDKYGDKIAVGIDAKDGFVAVAGWKETTKLDYLEFAKGIEDIGVSNVIFTDIGRDGTLEGPNFAMLEALKDKINIKITASGGIRDIDNIKALRDMQLYGAICGKSIYAGTLDLKEAISIK